MAHTLRRPPPPSQRRRSGLSDRIFDCQVPSQFDIPSRDFLPHQTGYSLVTEGVIRKELQLDRLPPDEDRFCTDLVRWITTGSKNVFLSLIRCGMGPEDARNAVHHFWFHNFHDERLSVSQLSDDEHHDIFPEDIWSRLKAQEFLHMYRWQHLAPVFTQAQYNYNLDEKGILPFIEKDANVKEGAFSWVHKVTIHSEHTQHTINTVAIKEIRVNRAGDDLETNEAWEREARALASINQVEHPHIIRCLAAIRRQHSRYFMFPWATGNSLRDLWIAAPTQSPNVNLIKEALEQLIGLAGALDQLHNFESSVMDPSAADTPMGDGDAREHGQDSSIRHGDLKPENLLRFLEPGKILGTLKIGDMGLAKKHVLKTTNRDFITTTRYGTIQYQPPEAESSTSGGLSRLYDTWSMGCIIFEFVIWLLYGNDRLERFYQDLQGNARNACPYYELPQHGSDTGATVHPVVQLWMHHLQTYDPECRSDCAIGDLLELAQQKLLVVDLPPLRGKTYRDESTQTPAVRVFQPPSTGDVGPGRFRATAEGLFQERGDIPPPSPPRDRPALLSPGIGVAKRQAHDISSGGNPEPLAVPLHPAPIRLKDWLYPVDNDFAQLAASSLGHDKLLPPNSTPPKLCNRCLNLDFWVGGFSFEVAPSQLKQDYGKCDLCRMLLGVCTKHDMIRMTKLELIREQSTLRIVGGPPQPVLTFLRSPDSRPPVPVQLGFPQLFPGNCEMIFQIARLWLQDCDTKHGRCRGNQSTAVPTRLIDVGFQSTPVLRLMETSESLLQDQKYVALSHPWGEKSLHPPFCSWRTDIHGDGHDVESFKRAIPFEKMPATFQHAVMVTRALGVRYIWIDSICIIQGKDGDFNEEASRMEDVFSGAYCVLAASRAAGMHDGFLGERRRRRDFVTFSRSAAEKPFYVCEPIDDFSQDVLESPLNKRGWVLQERALARRTVYFTETQMYFECGEGIRCETLARMQKLRIFQDLYKQYSRLQFTRLEDRAVAILGLENRLRKAYRTDGGFGIFDDGLDGGLFHRSLLWRRGVEQDDKPNMQAIVFPVERRTAVPKWSWMAYAGPIDYLLEPPFLEEMEWETRDIRPPWSRHRLGQQTGDAPLDRSATFPRDVEGQRTVPTLAVVARDYDLRGSQVGESRILFDMDRSASDGGGRAQCVVVARTKTGVAREARHYVLIVMADLKSAAGTGAGRKFYRLGVGYMLGKFITWDQPGSEGLVY
ncbi:HET-domain-containing protein [Apiospora marii]|uniref:HET-domain-containing protein n=1 Tax=Apiospora marii TaxID=335849 RepID=A0ABR1R5H8_9PEZI